jgi:hypothetical protein
MENPRRRRITLTHWLLIVIIAALVANAALQTISIIQRIEPRAVKVSPAAAGAALAEYDRLRARILGKARELDPKWRGMEEMSDDRESARRKQQSGPKDSSDSRAE